MHKTKIKICEPMENLWVVWLAVSKVMGKSDVGTGVSSETSNSGARVDQLLLDR